uniref:Uncharacterized protein n=1 Tax=Rhizophagus irregularis (strain DAOM 181602 / DAOM 197198 / MUCL 43194) TaxID=747089 RepID=U9U024_RHIID
MESRPFSNIISPPTVPKWFALLASRITTPNSYILRSEFISASATNFKGISIATPFPSSTYASFCNGFISRQNTWNNFIDQKISDTHNDNDASIVTLATLHLININSKIEELPTIEQMKKTFLDIYDQCLLVLLECINNKLADNQSRVLLDTISQISDLWILPQDDSDLTFIDLVKGFVPLSLSQFLSSL